MLAGIINELLNILGRFSFSSFPFFPSTKKKNLFFAESIKHSREKERDKGRREFKGYSPDFLRSLIESYESRRKRRNNIFIHLEKNKQTQKKQRNMNTE